MISYPTLEYDSFDYVIPFAENTNILDFYMSSLEKNSHKAITPYLAGHF